MNRTYTLDVDAIRRLYTDQDGQKKSYREVFLGLQKILDATFGIALPERFRRVARNMYHEINSDTPYVLEFIVSLVIEKYAKDHETIIIKNPKGMYNLNVGLGRTSIGRGEEPALKDIVVEGDVGSFYGGYPAPRPVVHQVNGSVGRSFGDNTYAGTYIVEGMADDSAAQVNHGADFLFKKKVGPRLAWGQRAGNVVALENLPFNAGLFMSGGTILSLGDVVEEELGPGILGGFIYTPKIHENVLGRGAGAMPVQEEDFGRIATALHPFIDELDIIGGEQRLSAAQFNQDSPVLDLLGKPYDFSAYWVILPRRVKKERESSRKGDMGTGAADVKPYQQT